MKTALVIGLGISGRSAASFLLFQGSEVWALEQNEALVSSSPEIKELEAKGLKVFCDPYPLKTFDLVVVSPGVPPSHPYYQAALTGNGQLIGEIELACRYMTQRCIGVTGTNGKTTVTLLITHVLNKSGIRAIALGNSGVPLTSLLMGSEADSDAVVVAELSSYQLETMRSRVLDVALLLNITPDHLDRYQTMQEYAQAKILIFDCLKPKGIGYVHESCAHLVLGTKTYGYNSCSTVRTDKQNIIVEDQIECLLPSIYRGCQSHDVENLLAAYAACREFNISADQFIQAVATFKKPPHRIEFVRQYRGISFIDDSKGTNIDAVMRAVESIQGHIVLIAGGVDKGASYAPWIEAFANKVCCLCVIGEAAEKMKQELSQSIPVVSCKGLEDAIHYAARVAKEGETVLLSPGCSSYDMFKDYAHRGEEFKRIVNLLGEE